MELPSSRFSPQQSVHEEEYISSNSRSENMATLTMRPGSLLPSSGALSTYDDRHSSRPRSEERSLPSIRQLLPPDLFEAGSHGQEEYRTDHRQYSPGTSGPPTLSPSSYAASPSQNKRRRLSADEERESRDFTHQRGFDPVRQASGSYSRSHSLAISPTSSRHYSTAESWQTPPSRGSPYTAPLPSIRTPHYDAPARAEFRPEIGSRPMLPSINALDNDRRHSTQVPRQTYEYSMGSTNSFSNSSSPYDPHYAHSQSFSYASAPRGHSVSGPSTHHELHRSPFANGPIAYGSHFHDGYLGEGFSEGKQRKRRGNLPKETTDKLRAWFMAHLHHPYPTEDEKQELMRQTGLQMNQISNWFINARRRQLPTMINNARAESDARSARADLQGTVSEGERESEGSAYDDDGYGSPRSTTGKRPSV